MLIVVLAASAGVFFFFYRMYHDDIKALRGFIASYERFDKAISDLSMSGADDIESKVGNAVIDLSAKAPLRLSSLIKNDAELMDQALEAADLARRELAGLRIYKSGIQSQNADLDGLAEESRILTGKRKAAYARFQELSGTR
ncbi:MAG: hypothetical protein IMZ54_09390 [Acidobacteria bacterium]|nr:hypothetical protein [Acidobacteriota bacterium]